jgi:hypothetical protein
MLDWILLEIECEDMDSSGLGQGTVSSSLVNMVTNLQVA